jgi:hypothetical protein
MKNKRELAFQRADELKELVRKANALHIDASHDAAVALEKLNAGMAKAWRCGQILLKIKKIVGHGRWLDFMQKNLPAIGERTAQRWMTVARLSPKATAPSDLTDESVRKYRLSYAHKERPVLEDRYKIPRVMHHGTVVNEFFKWRRRREIGLITANPTVEARDFLPVFEWLRDNLFPDA